LKDLLIGVDEVWLKGANRSRYMAKLGVSIQETIKEFNQGRFKVVREGPVYWVEGVCEFSDECLQAISCIPGVRNIELVKKLGGQTESNTPLSAIEQVKMIGQVAIDILAGLDRRLGSFKVDTRRSDKEFPIESLEVSREVGNLVLSAFPMLRVDLRNPESTLRIRILKKGTFVSISRYQGVGGLPLGISGHAICLLSGGIDSPVASYLMAARGIRQTFVFFHAYPFVGNEVKDKVIELAKTLTRYQDVGRLVVVPFGDIQNRIAETAHKSYRSLFFRRYMVRCANLLAPKIKAKALILGDSLGQVSSQTLENISVIDQESKLLILRPLIGMHKEEIVRLGERIHTFSISKLPHDDACELFASSHPTTRADHNYWQIYDQKVDLVPMLEEALRVSEVYILTKRGAVRLCSASEMFLY
jgi:thiamine biosynthesis protein ThiI